LEEKEKNHSLTNSQARSAQYARRCNVSDSQLSGESPFRKNARHTTTRPTSCAHMIFPTTNYTFRKRICRITALRQGPSQPGAATGDASAETNFLHPDTERIPPRLHFSTNLLALFHPWRAREKSASLPLSALFPPARLTLLLRQPFPHGAHPRSAGPPTTSRTKHTTTIYSFACHAHRPTSLQTYTWA
jgi:hypothetical protein